MKPKLLLGILVVLIALNVATIGSFAYFQWKYSQRGADRFAPPFTRSGIEEGRHGRHDSAHRPEFQLDPEERERLRELLADFQRNTFELREQVHELETEAFTLMERENVPRAELDSLLMEISNIRFEIRRIAVDKLIESKQVLTPEQQRHFFQAILETHIGKGMGTGRDRGLRRRGGPDDRPEGGR